MTNSEITPLLGNGSASSSNKKDKNKDGVRQHLLNFTPLQSFIVLLVLATITFSSVYLMIKSTLPKDLPEEQKPWLKFPRNAEDVQHLSIVLETYLGLHYYQVMACFVATYVAMMAFAIPGTVMLSVLAGALFKIWIGVPLVLFCCAFGASCCYYISYYLGHPIVEKHLKTRMAKLQVKIDKKRDQLFFYFAFLRVSPIMPNWFMSIASPHLGIPIHIYFFGTLLGVIPNTLVTVQAGETLAELASPDDFTLFTPQNIIMSVVVAFCLLIPIILQRRHEDPLEEDTKPVSGEAHV
ncbi:Transmembrane protein 41B [Modicella reniformis]|uniref:Transmembrane protein 41B n=1 Tax=Modicella reniformis TaxID=1440133 RepID=A0A9P6SUE6_9FUNG|nr:Transmembrane protein 41B [Modicella reniformis]